MKKSDKNEKKSVSSFSKELLLIIFGVLIGILGNQVFFRGNTDYAMKVELQKELLKEQYQYLNRILLFTNRYEITFGRYLTHYSQIQHSVVKGTNEVIKIDTINLDQTDTLSLKLPSFIIIKEKRAELIKDIEYIKHNKDKIDHKVYSKFEELLYIIEKNPLPKISNISELKKSNWNNYEIQEKWQKITTELYYLTYFKMY